MKTIKLDFSRSCAHNECARKDYYKSVKHLSGSRGSNALRNGSVIHVLLDVYYSEMKKGHFLDTDEIVQIAKLAFKQETEGLEFTDDYRIPENIVKLFEYYLYGNTDPKNTKDIFTGYLQEDRESLEILETEQYFKFEVKPTGEDWEKLLGKGHYPIFDTIEVDGLIDLQVKEHGLLTIFEHKSTGSAIKSVAPGYIVSSQPLVYALALKETTGNMPAMAVTNLLHMVSKRKKDGEYGKLSLGCGRFPIVVTAEKLADTRQYLIETAAKIAWAEETGTWMPSRNACSNKYGICGFLELCNQHRALDDLYTDSFVERKWEPAKEILKINNIKREVFGDEDSN